MWQSIKPYIAPIIGFITAMLYTAFRRRGERIAELENKIATTTVTNDLNALKKESENAANQVKQNMSDYQSLIVVNHDLANKLGVGLAPYQSDSKGDATND